MEKGDKMTDNLSAEDRIRKVRISFLRENPFFANISLYLNLIETRNMPMPTMGIDYEGNLYFDPDYVKSLTFSELKGVIAHEVLHLVLQHLLRKGSRDKELWNVSADLSINLILIEQEFRLPHGVLLSDDFQGMCAEEIYDKLYRTAKKIKVHIDGQGNVTIGNMSGKQFDTHYYPKKGENGNGNSGKKDKDYRGKGQDDSPLSQGEIKKLEDEWKKRIIEAQTLCFDEKTEILTKTGWKFIKNVKIGERVATLHTATKKLQFQPILEIVKKKYNGKMIRLLDKNTDVLVTPNHRFYIYRRERDSIKSYLHRREMFVHAVDLKCDNEIPRTAKWDNKNDMEYFIIPKYENEWYSGRNNKIIKNVKHEELKIPIDIFLEFLGWFISEGNCTVKKRSESQSSVARITITQAEGEKIRNLKILFKKLGKLGIKYSIKKRKVRKKNYKVIYDFNINNVQLATYFKQFGKSKDKYIPIEIKNLKPERLKILLDSLLNGDGYRHTNHKYINDSFSYYTTSKQLADDVQEIAIKIGYFSQIYKRIFKNTKYNPIYRITVTENKNLHWRIKSKSRKNKNEIYYNGNIYCVSVPNEVILVRRNGKPIFTGNSKQMGKMPAGLERMIGTLLEPKINWKALLYRYVTNEIISDCSYSRPHKKSESIGIYFPHTVKENVEIAVAIDSSGSIDSESINEFISEIVGIGRSFANLNMTLLVCDAKVHDVYEIRNGFDPKDVKIRGGGGTDFSDVFKFLEENKPYTKLLIFFTDLLGTFPRSTNIKTLWVVKGGYEKAPFGEIIKYGE